MAIDTHARAMKLVLKRLSDVVEELKETRREWRASKASTRVELRARLRRLVRKAHILVNHLHKLTK